MSDPSEMTDEELIDNITFEILRSINRPDLADELKLRLAQRLRPEDVTLLSTIFSWLETADPDIDLIELCDPWRDTWEERIRAGLFKRYEA